MLCGWEGNRRSGVAPAIRNRLQWFIPLRVHGLRKGDEHPAYTPHLVWHSFTFLPLTVKSYMVVVLLTFIPIIISIPSPLTLSFRCSLPFLLQDCVRGFSG